MTTKTLLLLALVVCTSTALSITGGNTRCLCHSFRDDMALPRKSIKRMEVLPPSNSCDQMEIILNLTNGMRICLNPSSEKIIEILKKLRSKKSISRA
ncbi:C-X-C motif chemokine 10-like [Anguilla anguilla]|uniref:C-X-C motif chemokine 10-like n=1 Tax=Anguilla anguilla TaxID=7936 RepID=UPI0015B29D33|nr:C-X-C motif chemokine 10-like [Anguilla anguilla]